jgi:starch synthase
VQQARTVIDIGACLRRAARAPAAGAHAGSGLPVYVVDAPYLYRRGGNPYQDATARSGPTTCSASRCWAGWLRTWRAGRRPGLGARQVVHAHDWHAAMACAYMADHPPTEAARSSRCTTWPTRGCSRCTTGRCSAWPARFMSPAGLEFHGQLSFMKAGLKFADRVTTVSPTYAREIATHEFGCGLDGVIRSRGGDVSGILNGIDTASGTRPPTPPSRSATTPNACKASRPAAGAAGRGWAGRRRRRPCCWWWSAG